MLARRARDRNAPEHTGDLLRSLIARQVLDLGMGRIVMLSFADLEVLLAERSDLR